MTSLKHSCLFEAVKRGEYIKLVLIPLAMAVAIYFLGYWGIESSRHKNDPWKITFLSHSNDLPAIVINQNSLGVSNVTVVLSGEQVAEDFQQTNVVFDRALNTPFPVPYGKVIFQDLTFLPGTVTLDLQGHGIELLPRTLILNTNQVSWKPGSVHVLEPEQKLHPMTPQEYRERVQELKREERVK